VRGARGLTGEQARRAFLRGLLADPSLGHAAITVVLTEKRRIPDRSVVMGIPGKVVREIKPEELERTRAINAYYLELAQRYARGSYPPPWTR